MPVTQSPFQMPQGPQVSPKTMTAAGQGGQMQPPYLQMRTQAGPPVSAPGGGTSQPTQPVVTPKPSAPGDPAGNNFLSQFGIKSPPPTGPGGAAWGPGGPQAPSVTPKPMTGTQTGAGPVQTPTPPQAGGTDLGGVYNFFKSDLENQRNQAMASAKADASARGVYYGSPLTGSEADISTQFQRGLGQLQAGMYGNEQQNQLARLGLASNLMWQNGMNQPQAPGPMDWSALGSIFGQSPATSGQRAGPTKPQVTPAIPPAAGATSKLPGNPGANY
jgi:hypothetical protein